MTTRKYTTEFGLNMVAGYRMILQQDDLSNGIELDFEPHIYFICQRPRISIDPTSFSYKDGIATLSFQFTQEGVVNKSPVLNIPANWGDGNLKIKSNYPHTVFSVVNEAGDEVFKAKSALALQEIVRANNFNTIDLEILYIGQSFGKNGEKTADKRLMAHSTLQEIYFDAMQKNPDNEIWLMLIDFEEFLITSMDGREKNPQMSQGQDDEHIARVLRNGVSFQQKINFTEAALIKYFMPPYNINYKTSFPSPQHSSYSECYDIDLNGVSVEINTEELHARLWSQNIEREWTHFCRFPLHDKEARAYMLEFLNDRKV